MANPSLAPNALAKPVKGSAAKAKRSRARLKATLDQLVYSLVDVRDGHRCRACQVYAGIDVHRHHLRGRKFTTLADVCHLCEECHGFLHVRVGGKLLKVYGNADLRNGLTVETRQNDGTWRTETGF